MLVSFALVAVAIMINGDERPVGFHPLFGFDFAPADFLAGLVRTAALLVASIVCLVVSAALFIRGMVK
jgi:hypothetical protein